MHYGHANALRQARSMGDYLVVGIHSDEEIARHKGALPVMLLQERIECLKECRWVDQIVPNMPYSTELASLNEYGCEFCVHGDDVVVSADGTDCYAEAKAVGRYKECSRTNSVSTTDLLDRMLRIAQQRGVQSQESSNESQGLSDEMLCGPAACDEYAQYFDPLEYKHSSTPLSSARTTVPITCSRIRQFCSSQAEPHPDYRIIYVSGNFDLLHPGHVEFLRTAKSLGDWLVVGLHSDASVRQLKGPDFPLLSQQERALSLLACRSVDDVIFDAPIHPSSQWLQSIYPGRPVSVIARGLRSHPNDSNNSNGLHDDLQVEVVNIKLTDWANFGLEVLLERVQANYSTYQSRNALKHAKDNFKKQSH